MPNIEIKAVYTDLKKAREVCRRLNAKFIGVDRQVDTYFTVPKGRLKLRESSLSGAFLIPYIRPDQEGPKKSDYGLIKVENAEQIKSLLLQIFESNLVVKKSREIYLLDNVRVHLDDVEGLGHFFELEAVYEEDSQRENEELKVRNLLVEFAISEPALQKTSYEQLAKQ